MDSNAKTEKVTHKRKASLVQTKKNLSLAKEGYSGINNTAFSGEGTALEINDIEVGLDLEPISYKQRTQKLANIIREVAAGEQQNKFENT